MDTTTASSTPQPPAAVRLVNEIVRDAIVAGASEVLLQAGPGLDVVQFRVDESLREHMRVPADVMPRVLRRIAVLSKLLPILPTQTQEGTAVVAVRGVRYDLGITITPTPTGTDLSVVIQEAELDMSG